MFPDVQLLHSLILIFVGDYVPIFKITQLN